MPPKPPADSSSPPVPIIVLTGFMGVGKSTIGRVLACSLHWRFVDLDCEIERRTSLRIHEIFAQQGEARFRQLENEALRAVLTTADTPGVIALGGGTYVQQENSELLRACGARVVFLELELETLLQRCRALTDRPEQNPRPLAADEAAFCALYAQRLPLYRQAELTVNAHDKTADQVAQEIASALGLRTANHGR
jgi:shikimate kinase